MSAGQTIRVEDLPGGRTSEVFHGHEQGASVSFFFSHGARGDGPNLHRHPYEEIFILQGGEATFTLGEETIEAREGDIVIVPARTPHKFVVKSEGYRSLNIHPVGRMETEWLE